METPNADLLEAIAVTAELLGTTLSKGALIAMAEDLSQYDGQAVLAALVRCRRELGGRLTLAAVIDRIDDGRPRADEAWAVAVQAMDEQTTVVMNDEISAAWACAAPIYRAGDRVGARMAFRDAYQRIVGQAREGRLPCKWWPSIGQDVAGREAPLLEAVRHGRLPEAAVQKLLPDVDVHGGSRLPSPDVQLPKLLRGVS